MCNTPIITEINRRLYGNFLFCVSISGSSVNSQDCEKQLKVQSIAWGWATVI